MAGVVKTRRWDDPAGPDEGLRLLVTRYRPRGLKKEDETWDLWWKDLGPSVELHAAFWGKTGPSIGFEGYRPRYLAEMKAQQDKLESIARKVRDGENVTLLCSSACTDETRCHRTLLKALIEERVNPKPPGAPAVRRK